MIGFGEGVLADGGAAAERLGCGVSDDWHRDVHMHGVQLNFDLCKAASDLFGGREPDGARGGDGEGRASHVMLSPLRTGPIGAHERRPIASDTVLLAITRHHAEHRAADGAPEPALAVQVQHAISSLAAQTVAGGNQPCHTALVLGEVNDAAFAGQRVLVDTACEAHGYMFVVSRADSGGAPLLIHPVKRVLLDSGRAAEPGHPVQ